MVEKQASCVSEQGLVEGAVALEQHRDTWPGVNDDHLLDKVVHLAVQATAIGKARGPADMVPVPGDHNSSHRGQGRDQNATNSRVK